MAGTPRIDLSEDLKPYVTYSVLLHLALFTLFLKVLPKAGPATQVYTIDFIGPATAIVTSGAAAPSTKEPEAASVAGKPPPQADYDEFGRRRRKRFVLPRPSLLRGFMDKPQEPQAPARPPARAEAPSGGETAGGSPGDAGISTDMPNFPYPWYISQLRARLWHQWSLKMPKEPGECVVVFSIMPGGGIVDLRTETSSGDAAFDLTAMSAVQDATPLPPLPRGFPEPFLKVHVTLTAQ